MVTDNDGRLLEVLSVWIADRELDARNAMPQGYELRKVPKHLVNAHSFLLLVFDEGQPKHCCWRNNKEDRDDEEEQRVGRTQECHQLSPDCKRQTIDDGKDAKQCVEDEDAGEVLDGTEGRNSFLRQHMP